VRHGAQCEPKDAMALLLAMAPIVVFGLLILTLELAVAMKA
jgi:hypothetical protein